ncbi:hypothetical protein PO590_13645 [Raoultella ornithinolytica]|uniref:hypothetical protein n=1 Tax=Raoultella ornithinolytica TaxID=54291 RepID=UPI002FF6D2D9
MSSISLTASDNEALTMMPDGWFTLGSVSSSLSRPAYRVNRLLDAGVLESRICGTYPNHVAEYHVKQEE